MKILILGATGMLGHAIHRTLASAGYDVAGAIRSAHAPSYSVCAELTYLTNVDALAFTTVEKALADVAPAVVINALGVIKQHADAADDWNLIQVNAAFPQRLQLLCENVGSKLIHFSTDCVFSGKKGNYVEQDIPDGSDWYGVSKYLGEANEGNSLTLRTSIIGRGLVPNNSLVDWFLAQEGIVTGYSNAFFSGLPVSEVGAFLSKYLKNGLLELCGLYHLSVAPISKYDLLCLLKEKWSRDNTTIQFSQDFVIDRSLDSSRLRERLSYAPDAWPGLVDKMFEFYKD